MKKDLSLPLIKTPRKLNSKSLFVPVKVHSELYSHFSTLSQATGYPVASLFFQALRNFLNSLNQINQLPNELEKDNNQVQQKTVKEIKNLDETNFRNPSVGDLADFLFPSGGA